MKKIISLFKRDYEGTRLVYDEVVPGAEWVLAGEGTPTVKLDGTSCLVNGGRLFKRYDVKRGRKKPENFIQAQEPDPVTGHWPGWIPVGDGPEDRWHREAWENYGVTPLAGTYELMGPKVQGNTMGIERHWLIRHGYIRCPDDTPRTFADLRNWFETYPSVEGIVWWRDIDDPDCDKVKIKRKDFGLPWPAR